MMTKKVVSLAAASAVMAMAVGIAPATAQEPAVLRIYSSFPLTGSAGPSSTAMVNAINMAIEQKTKGGLVCDGKFKIDYKSLDDATAAAGKWDAAKEQENANIAVADKDTIAYIGTLNSGAAKVSIPILNAANIAMVSPANTYPGLTKGPESGAEANEPGVYYQKGPQNYARVVPADDIQGAVGAKWAKSLGAKSVYILDDTELYGKGLANVFEKTAKEIGLKVLGRDGIDGKAADYKALATKIGGLKPNLIYFGGITQNNPGQILKDLRAAGVKALFMGADGIFDQAFIEAAGADVANGVLATFGGTPEKSLPAAGKKFLADYKAKYKINPEGYAIYAYEAFGVVLNAITKVCKADRAAVRDAVMSTKNFKGVLGTWSFGPTGDTTLTGMIGNRVVKGAWVETGALNFK
jgi:branched-chain amino acid transport system substrate-binding protein